MRSVGHVAPTQDPLVKVLLLYVGYPVHYHIIQRGGGGLGINITVLQVEVMCVIRIPFKGYT